MADIRCEAVRAALNTSSGTQDFTFSGFGTPKAAAFIFSHATADATKTAHCRFGFGVTDGTNQRAISLRAEDNQATSDAGRARSNADVIYVSSVTVNGTIDIEANWDSWVTDGVRINITNPPGSAFFLTVVLFGGDDLSAFVGDFVGNATQDATTTVTGVGFEPDCMIGFSAQANFTPATNTQGRCWLGFADNGAGLDQGGWSIDKRHNNAAGQATGAGSDTVWIRRHTAASSGAGTVGAGHEVTSYNSDGFVVTTRDASQGFTTGFLALNLNGGNHWMGRIDAPTSAQIQNNEDPGFYPVGVFAIPSSTNDALDTAIDSDEAGATGMCFFNENASFASMVTGDDGADPTDEESYSSTDAIYSERIGAAQSLVASLDSFDHEGFNLDFTTVQSIACKIWYLAIGGETLDRRVDETVEISESVHVTTGFARHIDETVNISESVYRLLGHIRRVDEIVNIGETVYRTSGQARRVDEGIDVSESVYSVTGFARSVEELVNIAEDLRRVMGLARSVEEVVNIPETVERVVGFVRQVDETMNIAEDVRAIPGFAVRVDEVVNILEDVRRLVTSGLLTDSTVKLHVSQPGMYAGRVSRPAE